MNIITAVVPTHESSLLLTLEEISQLVSHSHDPQETLANIVGLIHGRYGTDVSSVYLVDPVRGDLVLAATVGLDPSGVGRVRMRFDEGLTGLVAERVAPVMEADAAVHPRFKYFPEAGEDPFHSFLGVPIIESGAVQGVMVVQTTERRPFSPNEIRMLVTAASQLAPLVTGARLLEQVAAAARVSTIEPPSLPPRGVAARVLKGCSLSPGRGAGLAYVIDGHATLGPLPPRGAVDPAVEKGRLNEAVEATRAEISRLSRRISALVGEDHGAILQAQLMILQDRTVERDLDARLAAGDSAEEAVSRTLDVYVATFAKLSNPLFQERIFDIKDVFRRVFWHLRPRGGTAVAQGGPLVLVAREASVLDLFSVDLDRLVGVAVEHGGPQCHAGIMARSLGLPMIGQVHGLIDQLQAGRRIEIDGRAGTVDLDPTSEAIALSTRRPANRGSARACRVTVPPAPSLFSDRPGLPRVEANVNLLSEADQVVAHDAGAVGLYRSEMIFLARRTLPTEEEQVEIYRKLIEAVRGRRVTIRTFDLRPDKLAQGSSAASSSAHALDWRLVLEAPSLQRLFKEQVRAILRAASAGPIRLLVPLVNRSALLDFALATVNEARRELMAEGLPFGADVPFGAMIEATAAIPLAGSWAGRVDFFALGTNDLIASALGLNREDPVGAQCDDVLHPGVIRMIAALIDAAHQGGRPVSTCGEMASDPAGTVVLAALGADSLSVAVDRLADVRQTLAGLNPAALPSLRTRILEAETVEDVARLVAERGA